MPPTVLSLDELTGNRGTADIYLETAKGALKKMDLEDGANLIALTMDDPTVMQAFRRKFQLVFFWVLARIIANIVHSDIYVLFLDLPLLFAWIKHYDWKNHSLPPNEVDYLTDCTSHEFF